MPTDLYAIRVPISGIRLIHNYIIYHIMVFKSRVDLQSYCEMSVGEVNRNNCSRYYDWAYNYFCDVATSIILLTWLPFPRKQIEKYFRFTESLKSGTNENHFKHLFTRNAFLSSLLPTHPSIVLRVSW